MAQVKPVKKNKIGASARIAIIVSVIILIAFAFALVANSGFFARIKKGVGSDNFEFSGSMLTYYTNLVYQSWYSQYYYYIMLGALNFNPSLPLDQQAPIKDSYGILGLDSDIKTYYDYFYNNTKEAIEEVLLYCEAAKADPEANFAEIEAEADEYAANYITMLEQQSKAQGYLSLETYLRDAYGANVNKGDVKKVQKLVSIANTYSRELRQRIYDNMSDERKQEYFEENFEEFFTAEYLTYAVQYPKEVTYPKAEDYEGGEESAAYKAAVKKAEADKKDPPIADDYVGGEESKAYQLAKKEADLLKAENDNQKIVDENFMKELTAATTADEFKLAILKRVFDDEFKAVYNKAVDKFKAEEKPSEEELAAFKEEVKQAILDAVIAGKDDIVTEEEDKTEGDAEAQADEESDKKEETDNTKAWTEAKKKLPKDVIASLKKIIASATKTGYYSLGTDLGQKLFGGVKAEFGLEYESYEIQGINAAKGDTWYENTLLANRNSIEYTINKYKAELAEETDEAEKKTLEEAIKALEEKLEEINETIADTETKTGYYAYAAYFVTEAAHREETPSRNVGHILFQVQKNVEGYYNTSEDAKVAAQQIFDAIKATADANGVVSKDVFESFAKDTHDSEVFYDDVCKGDMVEEFENWLFEATVVGSIGLVETDYGWHIMYYGGESEASWMEYAQDMATDEDLDEAYDGFVEKHSITFDLDLFSNLVNEVTQ